MVGAGSPSKNFDFPFSSFGKVATVTLNLANLVRVHSTIKVKTKTSTVVCNPIQKAIQDGATPKEIKSAKESNS